MPPYCYTFLIFELYIGSCSTNVLRSFNFFKGEEKHYSPFLHHRATKAKSVFKIVAVLRVVILFVFSVYYEK